MRPLTLAVSCSDTRPPEASSRPSARPSTEMWRALTSPVTDPVAATYEIANYIQAVEQLTMTTLRNIVGGMDL